MPRRHALTDAELHLIQEGLGRLAAEAAAAQRAPHVTPEARTRLQIHATGITALAERMQATQQGRDYPNYAADRERQKRKRRQASLAKRLTKARLTPSLKRYLCATTYPVTKAERRAAADATGPTP